MPYQSERIIEIDCPDILLQLEIEYGHYINSCSMRKLADVRISKGDGANYNVVIGESVTQTQHPLFCVERFLFEHPSYDESVFALHGAAVEWKGKSYVFLASTTTGKTTLTSYLIHCGCGYLAEDCVLLDRSSYDLYPFTSPLHLREGGLDVLRRNHAMPAKLQTLHECDGSCRYIYTPSNCVEKAIPLGEIFFIERTAARNVVLPMTTTEKIAALMRSPITVYPVTAEYLKFLAKLASRYCKRILYSDMNFVKEVIEQHATNSFT